jgi:hypothetical protein
VIDNKNMDEQNQEYTPEVMAPKKKQTGSIIGSIIVIIVIIIGGLYFWGTKSTDKMVTPGTTDPMATPGTTDPMATPGTTDPINGIPTQDPIGDALRNASNSDDLGAIEADLNATDINNIDAGIMVE